MGLLKKSIDSRKVVEGNLYIPIHGVKNNGHAYVAQAIANGAKAVLWERKEPNPPKEVVVILVEDTTKALQDLAKAYRHQLNMKVVGITGSNGKTSTKDILASLLQEHYITQKTLGNYNNEIGVPLTLLSLSENVEAAVIEMGMENLGELSFLTHMVEPDIAIISNVGTAHLENLKTMENIAKAKLEIVEGLKEHGLFIYNGDQEILQNAVTQAQIPGHIRIRTFGVKPQNDYVISHITQKREGVSFCLNDDVCPYHVDMIGKHQAMNATAAWIAAKALGLSVEEIREGYQNIEKTVEGKYNSESKSYVIGITAATKKLTFIEAIRQGINQFIEYALLIFTTLGKLITDLTHTVSQLSGPVGIYTVTAQVTQSGSISTLLSLTALLSTNIGMFNLLPIPGLDGSQVLFALVEKIIRREIPTKMKYALQMAGLILAFGLMIFVTINDIGKFF